MYAWKQSGFASDFANLVEFSAIGTAARVQNFVAEDIFLEAIISSLSQRDLLFFLFRNRFDQLGLQSVNESVAFFLGMLFGVEGVLEVGADGLLEVGVYCVVKGEWRNFNLLDFELRVKVLDGANDFLDLRMPKFESLDHSIFADFERAGLHHHDGFFGRRDDD